MLRVPIAAAVAALAASTAAAAPTDPVVVADRSVGGVRIGAPLSAAVAAFGPPPRLRRIQAAECRATWPGRGLTLLLLQIGGGAPCRHGVIVVATLTSPIWRTARGLHVHDPVGRLRRLYPQAPLRADGWWLVTRHACAEVGGQAFAGLLARELRGRVGALVVTAGVCD